MQTVLVSGIIWVCCWSGALSRKQELTYKVGIKLCAQRCFSLGACTGIKMDTGQLHCQLLIDGNKDRKYNTLSKVHQAVWNLVPHLQCGANNRVVVSRRKGPQCVADHQSLSHSNRETLTSTTALALITDAAKGHPRGKAVGSSHGTVCKGNNVCRIKNSRCYGGVCLCDVGLYFSPKQNACLRECDEYGDGMDIYKGAYIQDYNDKILHTKTLDTCFDLCVQEKAFTCLTAEWNSRFGVCNFSKNGWRDVGSFNSQQHTRLWSLGQRQCK